MIFSDYLTSKRHIAELTLSEILHKYLKIYEYEPWSHDVINRLEDTIPKGKLMRYGLTQLGYEGYSKIPSKSVDILGVAFECVHTGLLFHDDIMDNDKRRRGNDSLYVTYAKKYEKSARDENHLGKSLAICVADFIFFIVFDMISHSDIESVTKDTIITMISREFARVTLSQMQDISFGQTSEEPTQEEIIRMYRGKTGRYSVSLPLVCGATVAKAPPKDIDLLWTIGETLGILYQIRDDALSLFGNESVTGKQVGSDIIQNKKTLFREYLMTHTDKATKRNLQLIFGASGLTSENLIFVQECLRKTGTVAWIDSYTTELSEKIKTDITCLTMDKKTKDIFCDFLAFITQRTL
jgi:geranylgeranyl diphosphate synthase, type I